MTTLGVIAMSILRKRKLLSDVRVATPCSVSWEMMKGDDRMRFCNVCRLNVYDLSAMDVDEAAHLISENDSRLCIRFFRRADGTIITQDCPEGVRRKRARRDKRGAVAGVGALAAVSALAVIPRYTVTMGIMARPLTKMEQDAGELMQAVYSGDTFGLRKLIRNGVDPDVRFGGETPLMVAARNGRLQICRALIHAGADVKAKNVEGQTALSLAQAGKHTAVVKLLKKSAPE
jgi:hypothetical protein